MTHLSESQRQFYLGSAGIRCWYARSPLPGAAPSPDFVFDEPETEPRSPVIPVSDSPPAADPQRARRLGHLREMMAGGSAAASAVADTAPTPRDKPALVRSSARPPVASSIEVVQPEDAVEQSGDRSMAEPVRPAEASIGVRWGFWVTDKMVLASGLGEGASMRLQDALALNILKALGCPGGRRRDLSWPVFSNPRIPGNGNDGLAEVLGELAREFGDRKLILLGVAAEGDSVEDTRWLRARLPAAAADFPHTLAGLATDPSRKKALWQVLKPLAYH
ncbi:MAG TPA: hypothetical protein VIN33_11475 [Marinobacter sp.]